MRDSRADTPESHCWLPSAGDTRCDWRRRRQARSRSSRRCSPTSRLASSRRLAGAARPRAVAASRATVVRRASALPALPSPAVSSCFPHSLPARRLRRLSSRRHRRSIQAQPTSACQCASLSPSHGRSQWTVARSPPKHRTSGAHGHSPCAPTRFTAWLVLGLTPDYALISSASAVVISSVLVSVASSPNALSVFVPDSPSNFVTSCLPPDSLNDSVDLVDLVFTGVILPITLPVVSLLMPKHSIVTKLVPEVGFSNSPTSFLDLLM